MGGSGLVSRQEALALLYEFTLSPNLRKHGLAVEAAMRAYARRFGEDEERWGLAGLLHDFDYERWPEPPGHPLRGAAILEERGYPPDVVHAIRAHADYTGVPRESRMDKALFACDELSGFIVACALVRPGRDIAGLEVGSVRKKLKDKAFARNVSRADIERGAAELGVPLDEHIGVVLEALKGIAADLELGG
ncbi:MAG: HDIG domain-containing protein [Firmicutes bacterium]|nr:HDIG domain-containing protein [Bacillota bacterium]